jgi:hypothetical protein
MLSRVRLAPPLLAVAAALLSTCGGGDGAPAAPVPVPPGSSLPAAPSAPVASSLCDRLGYLPDHGNCRMEAPSFLDSVDRAIEKLASDRPEIFDLNDQQGRGGYKVRNVGLYYAGVITNLQEMGLCARYDGAELQVKDSNAFNDQFHILLSTGYARRGGPSYRSTCYPAAFPPQPAPFPENNGCALPGSREIACGREDGSRHLGVVDAAIEKVARERPDVLDGNRILDPARYVQAVIEGVKAQGHCARFDGEELVVKKTNELSEQFDISTSSGITRRGDASYRSTCFPAAF